MFPLVLPALLELPRLACGGCDVLMFIAVADEVAAALAPIWSSPLELSGEICCWVVLLARRELSG